MTPTTRNAALLKLVRQNRRLILEALWLAGLRCTDNMGLAKGNSKDIRRWRMYRDRFNTLHTQLEKAL